MTDSTIHDRALAAFQGLAIGDALGMPTQSMSLQQIREDHGRITGFVDAGPRQRIAHGMPAASITDDTEQAVLVARLLVEGNGRLDPTRFAEALVDWERGMAAKGSLDLLGPSTKTAVQRILDGVPVSEAGSTGTTNGAAMRITPVGITTTADDLDVLVDAVQDASRVTHDTGLGMPGRRRSPPPSAPGSTAHPARRHSPSPWPRRGSVNGAGTGSPVRPSPTRPPGPADGCPRCRLRTASRRSTA